MARHPLAIAWDDWLDSTEGRTAADIRLLKTADDGKYLLNRLRNAFQAGARAHGALNLNGNQKPKTTLLCEECGHWHYLTGRPCAIAAKSGIGEIIKPEIDGVTYRPKRVYKVVAPNPDGNHTERILYCLNVIFTTRTNKANAISTAELDTLLVRGRWQFGQLAFVASTSTQISKLRTWYESQGIGKIKRIDSRSATGVRVCRYWLERSAA